MINHTGAYELFKHAMKQQLDFVVLVSYAIPVLQRDIALTGGGVPPVPLDPPDHFVQRRLDAAQLSAFAAGYEHELARTLVIASFSYFEAYVKAAIKELVEFHGGAETFRATAVRRSGKSLGALSAVATKAKRKLQEPDNKAKTEKYVVHAATLAERGFRFPSELFAAYGVARLLEKVSKEKRLEMKAYEIPGLLINAFHMTAFEKERETFDQIRVLRNDIAHGKRQTITLKTAISAGRDLRTWATAIDQHFVEHFFIQERYAP